MASAKRGFKPNWPSCCCRPAAALRAQPRARSVRACSPRWAPRLAARSPGRARAPRALAAGRARALAPPSRHQREPGADSAPARHRRPTASPSGGGSMAGQEASKAATKMGRRQPCTRGGGEQPGSRRSTAGKEGRRSTRT